MDKKMNINNVIALSLINILNTYEEKGLTLILNNGCMDEIGSIIAIKEWLLKNGHTAYNLKIIYTIHEDNVINVTNKNVFMIGFLFDKTTVISMISKASNMIIIDHHKINKKILKHIPNIFSNIKESNATLMWELLLGDRYPLPALLQYIKDGDSQEYKLPNSKIINNNIKLIHKNDDLTMTYTSFLSLNKKDLNLLFRNTKNILKKDTIKTITINGAKVPCLNNNDEYTPELKNALAEKYNMFVYYTITSDNIIFSFKSINNYDVLSIAKIYGGGGHKLSSICIIKLTDIDLSHFLINKDLDEALNTEACAIRYLQERGYSVSADIKYMNTIVNEDTENYIREQIDSNEVYLLCDIENLLGNDNLKDETIRNNIKKLINEFQQTSGKPECILF